MTACHLRRSYPASGPFLARPRRIHASKGIATSGFAHAWHASLARSRCWWCEDRMRSRDIRSHLQNKAICGPPPTDYGHLVASIIGLHVLDSDKELYVAENHRKAASGLHMTPPMTSELSCHETPNTLSRIPIPTVRFPSSHVGHVWWNTALIGEEEM